MVNFDARNISFLFALFLLTRANLKVSELYIEQKQTCVFSKILVAFKNKIADLILDIQSKDKLVKIGFCYDF